MSVTLPDLHHPNSWEYNVWLLDQIWRGDEYYTDKYQGGVVPNLNDTVREYMVPVPGGISEDTYQDYRVTARDPVTLISTLIPINPVNTKEDTIGELLYAGLGTGRVNDSDVLFVNPDLVNLPAQVDIRLSAKGSNTSYYRLFLGTDITETGTVLSVQYDPSGAPINDQIPLEMIDDSVPDKLIFKPKPCNLNRLVKEGELVTLVAYNDSHGRVCYQPLTVAYDSTALPVNPYVNYIRGIRLDSPYLSPTDDYVLNIPENFLNSSLLTDAYVDYKDGSSRKVTIGQEGMLLHGLNDIRGEWAGREQPLVLQYTLKDGEYAAVVQMGGDAHLSQVYSVVTTPADEEYSVKLYVCPRFISSAQGYDLRFWLYNLQRDMYHEVTSLVTFGTGGTGAFQPKAYGTEQHLVFNLQLNDVDGSYPEFLYTQDVKLTLIGEPIKDDNIYLINYNVSSTREYGEHIQFIIRDVSGDLFLDISSGLTQYSDWLDKLYAPLESQYNSETTDYPPEPTNLILEFGGESLEFDPAVAWDQQIPFPYDIPDNASECYIRWQTTDAGGTKQDLAKSQVFVFQEL